MGVPASRRTHPLVKVAVAVAALGGLSVLFMRSLEDTRAEPFTVQASRLESWTLVTDGGADSDRPVLSLAPPPELPMRLFRQVFSRAGESLSTPTRPGIALALSAELGGAPVTPDELAALARDAGIGRGPLRPRCMGFRRESQQGSVRQIYFVVFDMPEFAAFRQGVAARLAVAGVTSFDASGLSPVMPLAAQPDFARWMPIVVDPDRDCIAPIETE